MKKSKQKTQLVYAIYPNANGYGFVYMKNARTLLDWGVIRVNPINNTVVLKRIKKSFEFYKPAVVILQNPEGKYSRTGKRVQSLIKRVIDFANKEKFKTAQYSRDELQNVFEQFGATTKYEIASFLLTEFEELKPKKPYKRTLWMSEDRNMAIFDALSLAIIWYWKNE